MKRTLLLFLAFLALSAITNAQNKLYTTFGGEIIF